MDLVYQRTKYPVPHILLGNLVVRTAEAIASRIRQDTRGAMRAVRDLL